MIIESRQSTTRGKPPFSIIHPPIDCCFINFHARGGAHHRHHDKRGRGRSKKKSRQRHGEVWKIGEAFPQIIKPHTTLEGAPLHARGQIIPIRCAMVEEGAPITRVGTAPRCELK